VNTGDGETLIRGLSEDGGQINIRSLPEQKRLESLGDVAIKRTRFGGNAGLHKIGRPKKDSIREQEGRQRSRRKGPETGIWSPAFKGERSEILGTSVKNHLGKKNRSAGLMLSGVKRGRNPFYQDGPHRNAKKNHEGVGGWGGVRKVERVKEALARGVRPGA